MVITLRFEDFTIVSSRQETYLSITLLDFTQFQLRDGRRALAYVEAGLSLKIELPKQQDTSSTGQMITSTISSVVNQVKSATVVTSLVNVATAQSLSQVWSLVNILQVIVHLPLMKNLYFP
mmetsp:Transcript_28152/g.42599  ORF Transcript_28152/g.42599 Transcript_28152/m.42599 type:complete len:121 (-) Transcript_28152:1711-2073(-)